MTDSRTPTRLPVLDPPAEWDGRTMTVRLPDPRRRRVMEAKWDVNTTSVARIREVGTEQRSVGFETPFRCCRFVGLKPDTAHQVEVRFRTAGGEGRTGDRADPHRAAGRLQQQRGAVPKAGSAGVGSMTLVLSGAPERVNPDRVETPGGQSQGKGGWKAAMTCPGSRSTQLGMIRPTLTTMSTTDAPKRTSGDHRQSQERR